MRELLSSPTLGRAPRWLLRLTACILILLYAVTVLGALRALAQEAAPPAGARLQPSPPDDLQDVIHAQFGECFQLSTQRSTAQVKYRTDTSKKWINFLVGDLDADGVEDAVIVARCKTPLAGAVDYSYKAIDPYHAAFGYGNPKITSQFQAEDPDRQNLVLVIHGAGEKAWRAETPKGKWAIMNLPFDQIGLTRVLFKKKPVMAVNLIEGETFTSAVFYDGKNYQWRDTAGITP